MPQPAVTEASLPVYIMLRKSYVEHLGSAITPERLVLIFLKVRSWNLDQYRTEANHVADQDIHKY